MTVKLNCSSSGTVSLVAPASTNLGADVVLNLPSHAGSLDRLERAGNILQVVEGSTNTIVSMTALTYADTGLTASITPSSTTSKVLVFVDQFFQITRTGSNIFGGIRLLRDSVTIIDPITDGNGPFSRGLSVGGGTSTGIWDNFSHSILDSPNTTNSVTYKTQGRPYQSGETMIFQNASTVNGKSRILLMEVAA
jgi:hypothetical protein|tara:strand:+ start:878 stop:1459 length:582 start_codon:yes stop_codon:yes gene_type:complete